MLKVLFITVVTSGIWLLLIRSFTKKPSMPLGYYFAVGLMGGAFAVQLVDVFNITFFSITGIKTCQINFRNPVNAYIVAILVGFNEEAWKLIATLIILDWHSRQSKQPLNLLVFGIVISLGFDFWENIQYGDIFGWQIVLWRSIIPGHQVYGAIWSYGLSEGYSQTKYRTDVQLIIACYILAAVYHSTYNFLIFLKEDWGFFMAIVISWLPMIFFYKHLKRLYRTEKQVRSGVP